MLEPLLVLLSVVVAGSPLPATQEPDLERAARDEARRYESLLVRRTPYWSGGLADECHEIIGRFCFRFGDDEIPDPPPEPEHPDVKEARQRAVRAFRRWLSGDPANPEAAGGLIRYLIEDGRAQEAVSAARTHAWAAPGTDAFLLFGLALHESADFAAAEAAFDSARTLATASERARLDDVGVLLTPRERSTYGDLGPEARTSYQQRFWAFSDPSRLVPGNERRSAHYARHAWARILAAAPRVRGTLSWGDDRDEIVLRYGVPESRQRVRRPPHRLEWEPRVVSVYDPAAVSFVPSALRMEGVPREPLPGVRPVVERDTVSSAYAPIRLHRMRGLTAQVTRVPMAEGWLLRVDAMLPPDTAEPRVPVAPRGLLTVFDSAGSELARSAVSAVQRADSVTVARAEVQVPGPAYAYQIEMIDDSTALAGLARYRIDPPADGLAVSDPLIARPPPDTTEPSRAELQPFPTRVLSVEQPVLVWAEVRGLARVATGARYSVEWWMESRDQRSIVGRALRWMGRKLGLAEDPVPVRLRWEGSSEARDPVPIAFTVDLAGTDAGLYRLGLRVRDRVNGQATTAYRTLRLVGSEPGDGPGRD